ncbi:MAG TPA: NAD(P)-dependent oxidoreductase [Fimbriiglobus sp.]|nr:NAD(P)-dependent oxidoreductase [Fimbriiglobus sp.]
MTPRVLITGGTGFLGLPCARRLVELGMEVHVTARHRSDELPIGAKFYPIDMLKADVELIPRLISYIRPTHLLHLAWIATPSAYWDSPLNSDWLRASVHTLMSFGLQGGLRVVAAGTCAEYDWSRSGVYRENAKLAPTATAYSHAKNSLRYFAEVWGEKGNHSVAWARLFFLYGPREHPARLVPSVATALLAGRPAETTAGTQERDFLHVEDAADALVRLLLSDVTGPVNIGSGEPVALRTVAETLAHIVGRPDLLRLGVKLTSANEPPQLVADVGRLRSEVGWSPRIELRQGLAETVAWWRSRDAA